MRLAICLVTLVLGTCLVSGCHLAAGVDKGIVSFSVGINDEAYDKIGKIGDELLGLDEGDDSEPE